MHEFVILEIRIAPWTTSYDKEVHRREDRVNTEEGEIEVDLAESLVQHATEHFREPIERAGEHAENGCHSHDHVEVPDHEISIMKIEVERGLAEEDAADSAADE